MQLKDYQLIDKEIRAETDRQIQYRKYVKLMEIFVQDCWLVGVEPFYGNLTKQKSDVLFELQSLINP